MVKLYTSPKCVYCNRAKVYLIGKGVKFKEIDISTDSKSLQEIVKKSGQMSVPVLEVGEKVVIGFNEEKWNTMFT